ncbi:coiled-coil domain-containing protein 96 [Strongylocentrotus purpuratus]|uniref:CCDC113/CCDC96 coiled-coil domain-containing protein n=1 Tax=Strongylocentrotus purpuratus TaxID=7668 RepID=A0A7M7NW63_STRPU|nr:coiled-coil domain-containing protein 96 [Strongylocentrotus purpuratus]
MADEETPAQDPVQESTEAPAEAEGAVEEASTPAPETAENQEATPPPAEGEASPAANQEPTDTPAPEEEQAEQPTADGSPGAADGDASPAEGGEATPAEAEGQEGGETASPGADGEKGEGDGEVKEGEEGKEEEEQKPAEGETGDGAEGGEGGEGTPEGEEGAAKEEGDKEQGEGEGDGEATPAGDSTKSPGGGDEEGSEKPEGEEEEEGEGEEPKSPIPQSDTFQEGDRPETPTVQVMEPLSREGSPPPNEPAQIEPAQIEPGTPEREISPLPEEEALLEEEEEDLISREELIEMYQGMVTEREQLNQQNVQLQHKLAEYFRKKKTDDQKQEMDKNVTDQEQRYLKYMSNLDELRKQEEEERELSFLNLEELKDRKLDKQDYVENENQQFLELKRQVALTAISSRTGKPIAQREVEVYIFNELKKEEEVKQVRLENIKLKNRLKKREQQLKAKEELAEGLHLIDFEQLKIENQTYNEKIEERNEELLKLRKKITSTVQVLTHVKEKLQFVQAENHVQKGKLREVEELVAQKRDVLSRTKKARDSLRIDNQRLRQKSGLLGKKSLLLDFEERKDEGDELRARMEYMKRHHAELTLNLAGVKKKIDAVKAGRS